MNATTHAEQILTDYEFLEPGEADTWNPLRSEFELSYRLSIFYALTQALALSHLPLEAMRVLDVGCGNGRSTRMYVDLGLRPEQLLGLDLRPGTIELAKKLNPAIQFATYDGSALPFPNESFNWTAIAGVTSSIKGNEERRKLADDVVQKLQPGGYVFFFDLYRANWFAGHDRILPLKLFPSLKKVWYQPLRSYQFLPDSVMRQSLFKELQTGNMEQFYTKFRSRISQVIRPSHIVLLAQKV